MVLTFVKDVTPSQKYAEYRSQELEILLRVQIIPGFGLLLVVFFRLQGKFCHDCILLPPSHSLFHNHSPIWRRTV